MAKSVVSWQVDTLAGVLHLDELGYRPMLINYAPDVRHVALRLDPALLRSYRATARALLDGPPLLPGPTPR